MLHMVSIPRKECRLSPGPDLLGSIVGSDGGTYHPQKFGRSGLTELLVVYSQYISWEPDGTGEQGVRFLTTRIYE